MTFHGSVAAKLERAGCLSGAHAVWSMWRGYLLFVDSHTRGDVQTRIENAVDTLAARLLAFDAVAWSVRRIVGLEVDTAGGLDAEARFAYERAERPPTPFG